MKKALYSIGILFLTSIVGGCVIHPKKIDTHLESIESKLNKLNQIEQFTKNATIPEIQVAMNNGKISAEALVSFYIEKIERENDRYNAIISINPKAIELAKESDRLRSEGKLLGALHGIPIVVKDNIETKNMATTAGSILLKNNYTNRDAPLIENLKQEGAIILAKTNLSEWANFRSTRSSSGWSGLGGQTKNPHDETRSTCGSSSGSGAAIAANLAVAAVGTETDGSITCPASATGIVGIKPTVGLVSRRLIVPISHSQDTAGPMAKNMIDAAILLEAMQGEDKKDSASKNYQFDFNAEYSSSLSPDSFQPSALNSTRFGILASPAMNHEMVKALFQRFKNQLVENKVFINEDISTEPYNNLFDEEFSVLMYEFKHDLNSYLKALPNLLNQLTLKKLIELNLTESQTEMPYFQQEIFEMSQAKGPLTEQEYISQLARLQKATREDGLDKLLKENKLDAILSVTLGPAWKIDKVNGDHYTGGISSYSAISGYPHITIPLGNVHGLPIGLSIMGAAADEKALIEIAFKLERLIKNSNF